MSKIFKQISAVLVGAYFTSFIFFIMCYLLNKIFFIPIHYINYATGAMGFIEKLMSYSFFGSIFLTILIFGVLAILKVFDKTLETWYSF